MQRTPVLYLKAEQERFPFPAAGTHGERDRDRARVALQQRELHERQSCRQNERTDEKRSAEQPDECGA